MVVEIRATKKDFAKLSKLKSQYDTKWKVPPEKQFLVTLTDTKESVIMLQQDGKLEGWPIGRGYRNISTWLRLGYVFPKGTCPFSPLQLRPCKGEKCPLFLVSGELGKCSLFFSGISYGNS